MFTLKTFETRKKYIYIYYNPNVAYVEFGLRRVYVARAKQYHVITSWMKAIQTDKQIASLLHGKPWRIQPSFPVVASKMMLSN